MSRQEKLHICQNSYFLVIKLVLKKQTSGFLSPNNQLSIKLVTLIENSD